MGRDRSRSPSSRHRQHRHDDSSRDRRDREDRKRRGGSERDSERNHELKRRHTPDTERHHKRHERHERDGKKHSHSEKQSEQDLEALRRGREARDRNFYKQEREQIQFRNEEEDVHYKEWLAKEDDFMLVQAKKRAVIRVREGREKPIDAFVINLKLIEEGQRQRVLGDDEIEGEEFYITEPDEVIKPLSVKQMSELKEDIEEYLRMEKSKRNKEFWQAVIVILDDYQSRSTSAPESRAVSNVADEIDALLSSKTYEQLETLESQINTKLHGDEPVDVDYWQQLLHSLKIWKAKARLRAMHEPVKRSRPPPPPKATNPPVVSNPFDPENFTDPTTVHDELLEDNDAFTQAAQAMFDTATTRIVEEGVETEENFNVEADDVTHPEPTWSITEYRPRKPKFFNRIVMGYEWNKYNQTHYDEANPPPKVVQGYKFNIFYPNLADMTKTPTYKVERNRQRRKYVGGGGGTSAGEDETCILRFMAGPPYLDIAFRIIDRDWDYSSRFNRGFKSSFEKGILQLHFQFKKVFYRK